MGPLEHVTYEFVPTSPAVSHMSGSSNFDNFRAGWLVALQLPLYWVLLPGLVRGARGVMVIELGNGLGDTNSNPRRG